MFAQQSFTLVGGGCSPGNFCNYRCSKACCGAFPVQNSGVARTSRKQRHIMDTLCLYELLRVVQKHLGGLGHTPPEFFELYSLPGQFWIHIIVQWHCLYGKLTHDCWLHLFGWFDRWPLTECGRSCNYGRIEKTDTHIQTDRQSHRTTTVMLDVHVCWGLIIKNKVYL